MSSSENGPPGEVETDRWRRRLTSGDALSTSEALRLSEDEAARLAERAKSARGSGGSGLASIRRQDHPVEQLTVHEFTVGESDPVADSASIDGADTTIDLRHDRANSSGQQTAAAPISERIDLRAAGQASPEGEAVEENNSVLQTSSASALGNAAASAPAASAPPTEISPPGETSWPTWSDPTPAIPDVVVPETPDTTVVDGTVLSERVPAETVPAETVPAETVLAEDSAPKAEAVAEIAASESSATQDAPAAAPEPSTLVQSSSSAPQMAEYDVMPATAATDPDGGALSGRKSGLALLLIASGLAILAGILATMWVLERSSTSDLRDEIERAQAAENVAVAGLEEVNSDVRTLQLENERLQQQLNDMSALVLELPEGRVTEIAVPFTPTFADEENGRLIAVSADGEYITWGEGADGPITDSGNVSGSPTGLFAATRKAWVSTDAGQVDALSLVAGEPGLGSVDVGPISFLAAEERGYWTYNSATQEVVRLKKSDGGVTAAVSVPVPVVDLTIGAGSVWALGDDGRVYRINTADLTVSPLDAGGDLISITAGPDALWTLSAADGSLRRIDPVTGDVLVTVPVGRDPIDATFAGRSVWVALRAGSSLIEVDTRTAAVVSRTPLPSEPTALHQGDSGVFVTTSGDVPLLRVASTAAAIDPVVDDQAETTDESS